MRRMFIPLILLVPVLAAAAGPITIKGIGTVRSLTCEPGQEVRIGGTGHGIDLNGDCGVVTITGSGQVVSLDGVARIELEGAGHVVTWQRNLSGEPSLPIRNAAAGASVKHVEAK